MITVEHSGCTEEHGETLFYILNKPRIRITFYFLLLTFFVLRLSSSDFRVVEDGVVGDEAEDWFGFAAGSGDKDIFTIFDGVHLDLGIQ